MSDDDPKPLTEMTIDELIISTLLASALLRRYPPRSVGAIAAHARIAEIRTEAQSRDNHPLIVFSSEADRALPVASNTEKTGGRRSRRGNRK